jgi:hypothetical protein
MNTCLRDRLRATRTLRGVAYATCLALLGACDTADQVVAHDEPVELGTTLALSFEAWKQSVRFPGKTDIYAVGDELTPFGLVGDEEARTYYDLHVAAPHALTLHSGQRNPGDPKVGSYFPERAVLRYCIDRPGWADVASRHEELAPNVDLYDIVDQAFGNAASAWNLVSGLEIRHDISRDDSCTPRAGDNVTWYVRPLSIPEDQTVEYLAFVLRPDLNIEQGPGYREFFVWEHVVAESTFEDSFFASRFTLDGLLAHTIGQGLGFIGEHNRTDRENGVPSPWPSECRDPSVGGIYLSILDTMSVMSHPQSMHDMIFNSSCTGAREFDYAISYVDAFGAACQYKGEHGLYYCNPKPQEAFAAAAHCSPVPLFPGAAGDCGEELDFTRGAAQYEAALITSITK